MQDSPIWRFLNQSRCMLDKQAIRSFLNRYEMSQSFKIKCILFTDGSVNPKLGIGYGAYLALPSIPEHTNDLANCVRTRQFEKTSSTQLELRTLIWALSELPTKTITAYTDSQNIPSLLERKERLTNNDFCSKSGKPLKNKALYQCFFETIETVDIEFRWLSGHKPSKQRDSIDRLFTLVDRASRNALRSHFNTQ